MFLKIKLLLFPLAFVLFANAQDFFVGQIIKGDISYYNDNLHGNKTASGSIYDKTKISAAHSYLPFGTIVEVRNSKNNSVLFIEINDRMPKKSSRILDISKAAAEKLNVIDEGVFLGEIKVIQIPKTKLVNKQNVFKTDIKTVTNEISIQKIKLYGIQLGSFTDKTSLMKRINELSFLKFTLDENLFIKEEKINNKVYFKLIHGFFGHELAKKKVLLISKSIPDVFIVKY